ncbi:hypothetical protein O181_016593 [Austropuccinia psidii MF-1]|uniref:Integrase catalytic domain-containing protein n=1 Tax=Austropuccinia psidii MF-1 TaxID=1389203 RepID=A0A9Q3C5G2_9BASI|nr:hypothetical protein [Austropuccinia psidii MF-1]
MRNLRDMLIKPPSTIKNNANYLKKKEMVYHFIVGHHDDENYEKFVSNETGKPYKLWKTIKEHYESSSGEKFDSHFGKVFSIKFPPSFSGLSEAISSFRSTPKLLRGLSPRHPSNRVATKMWPGVDFSAINCDSCSLAKSHRLPFSGTLPSPLNVLHIVHMDLCGPISLSSCGGNPYIFQIINGHSHMRFVYLLSAKLECFKHFLRFQRLVENLKGRTIKTVVSDNGGEFVNLKFKNLLDIHDIFHLPTALYTPQQNPIAERGSQSLLKQIQVMMQNNSVPAELWREESAMAAFLFDRTPISTLNFVAPLSKWDLSVSLNLTGLHPFGCTAIINSPKAQRESKINPTGTLCMLVGIQEGHHNYCLFDHKANSIHISHDCIFKDKEDFWPSHSASALITSKEPFILPSIPAFDFSFQNHQNPANKSKNILLVPGEDSSGDISENPEVILICDTASPSYDLEPPMPLEGESSPPLPEQPESNSPGTSMLAKDNNPFPKGWVYDSLLSKAPQDVVSSGRLCKPPNFFAGEVINNTPHTFKESMASSKSNAWMVSIQSEICSLEDMES